MTVAEAIKKHGLEWLRGKQIMVGAKAHFIDDSCLDAAIELWADEPEKSYLSKRFYGAETRNDNMVVWIYGSYEVIDQALSQEAIPAEVDRSKTTVDTNLNELAMQAFYGMHPFLWNLMKKKANWLGDTSTPANAVDWITLLSKEEIEIALATFTWVCPDCEHDNTEQIDSEMGPFHFVTCSLCDQTFIHSRLLKHETDAWDQSIKQANKSEGWQNFVTNWKSHRHPGEVNINK